MRRLAVLVTAALLAPAVPSLAAGSTVVRPLVEAVQLPADGLHRLAAGERMIGVTWTCGAPRVDARWHTAVGWTSWRLAEDDSDEPEAHRAAAGQCARRDGEAPARRGRPRGLGHRAAGRRPQPRRLGR
ncbi:MAG: hypothetical protein LC779_05025 [Actinobacteria bacterium]|nr:hypothetical protein [Actinomycetota bacterium]